MLITGIAIKLYDGGPVFFRQKRCTIGGKVFEIHKFRSMIVDAEKEGEVIPAKEDDERITPVGKFIRKTRIDELPQFIDILKGDMSFIGPRPLLVKYLERYNEEQHHRHDVRPGLTGYAQVHGRNAIGWDEKFALDLEYVKNITFFGDIKIFLDTVKVVLKRDGINSATAATMEEFMGTDKK